MRGAWEGVYPQAILDRPSSEADGPATPRPCGLGGSLASLLTPCRLLRGCSSFAPRHRAKSCPVTGSLDTGLYPLSLREERAGRERVKRGREGQSQKEVPPLPGPLSLSGEEREKKPIAFQVTGRRARTKSGGLSPARPGLIFARTLPQCASQFISKNVRSYFAGTFSFFAGSGWGRGLRGSMLSRMAAL